MDRDSVPGVEISSVMPQPVYFPNPALTATSHGPMSADTGLPVALALPLAQSVVPPSAHVPETYKVVPVLCSWAKRYHIVDGHGETYADATGLALWCAGDIVTLRSSRDGTALMRIHRHADPASNKPVAWLTQRTCACCAFILDLTLVEPRKRFAISGPFSFDVRRADGGESVARMQPQPATWCCAYKTFEMAQFDETAAPRDVLVSAAIAMDWIHADKRNESCC